MVLFLAWAKVMIASVALPRPAAAAIDVKLDTNIQFLRVNTIVARRATIRTQRADLQGAILRRRTLRTRARSNRRGTQPLFVSVEAGIEAHGTIAAATEGPAASNMGKHCRNYSRA
jgi:hypothetical protein